MNKQSDIDALENMQVGTNVQMEYLPARKTSLIGTKCTGKVVHVFLAFKVPDKDKIIKYYGEEIVSPTHARVFGPMKVDRIVIKKDTDNYSVITRQLKTLNYISLTII